MILSNIYMMWMMKPRKPSSYIETQLIIFRSLITLGDWYHPTAVELLSRTVLQLPRTQYLMDFRWIS